MALKFYTNEANKGLRLKARDVLAVIPTFVEVTGESWQEGSFWPPHILNSVKKEVSILGKYSRTAVCEISSDVYKNT